MDREALVDRIRTVVEAYLEEVDLEEIDTDVLAENIADYLRRDGIGDGG